MPRAVTKPRFTEQRRMCSHDNSQTGLGTQNSFNQRVWIYSCPLSQLNNTGSEGSNSANR